MVRNPLGRACACLCLYIFVCAVSGMVGCRAHDYAASVVGRFLHITVAAK